MSLEPPEDFKQRVKDEAKELEEKLMKLDVFINKNSVFSFLHPTDKNLLTEQRLAMTSYLSILRQRISRFPESQT